MISEVGVDQQLKQIALLGNPNVGKTSLFNALTGMNQKVGNFPGVTVDKKTGSCRLGPQQKLDVIDLPGVYSLFAKSPDERVVLDILLDPQSKDFPEVVVVIVDALHLERSLMLLRQAQELGFPVIPVLNMMDVAEEQGLQIDTELLSERLGAKVYPINARKGIGLATLKKALASYTLPSTAKKVTDTSFAQKLLLTQGQELRFLSKAEKAEFAEALKQSAKDATDLQLEDTFNRMHDIQHLLDGVLQQNENNPPTFTERLDKVVTHPFWGYLIYFGVLLSIFQLIFSVAEYPMTWIDEGFGALNGWLKSSLPESVLTQLLTEGVVAGIGGVVIFVPQIALLFGVIALLEESGYMSRVIFLMDRPMRLFGLSGKSVVPLISGAACAVPAIMAARSISDWRERLATVFVTPLISCAARLPVYVIIIALVIPGKTFLGFNLKGLTLLALYILGIVGALLTAMVMQWLLSNKERPVFVIDLPSYKAPRWRNVLLTIYQKTRVFVIEAGKVILAISIILWALASYGPPKAMQAAKEEAEVIHAQHPEQGSYESVLAAQQLEASYIGQFGHFIEPVFRPLGYDWKIDIALISSFAAREVFVGTLGTIYSVGEEDFDKTLLDKMEEATFSDTGKPVYTLATGLSLLIFYVFAMQCMSTLAIVYRETGGWKWPLIQLVYMSALAYVCAWITYLIFS